MEAKFNAVILSVDKALIVSGDQGLRDAAIDVEEDLGDALVASYDALGATEAEAEQAFSEFDDALGESEESLNELIAVVQELVTLD